MPERLNIETPKNYSHRRDIFMSELQPSCHRKRKDDEGIRRGVTERSVSVRGVHDSKDIAYRRILSVLLLCAYSIPRSGLDTRNLYHLFSSTDKQPSVQKYSGTYSIAEANNANHSQMY